MGWVLRALGQDEGRPMIPIHHPDEASKILAGRAPLKRPGPQQPALIDFPELVTSPLLSVPGLGVSFTVHSSQLTVITQNRLTPNNSECQLGETLCATSCASLHATDVFCTCSNTVLHAVKTKREQVDDI